MKHKVILINTILVLSTCSSKSGCNLWYCSVWGAHLLDRNDEQLHLQSPQDSGYWEDQALQHPGPVGTRDPGPPPL